MTYFGFGRPKWGLTSSAKLAVAVYDLSWASAHRKSVSPCGATSRDAACCHKLK